MTVKKQKLVRGAGGGGGKGGGGGAAAVEATDSLHSKQFARVVDLISEGPIVGLVDGVNSVYLNETPLATNGVFNFKDVGLNWTTGTQTQLTKGALAAGAFGFDDVRYPNQVNVIVPSASPVVRTLSNANVNTIVVTVSVPSLLSRDASNGNTNPSKIDLAIDLQSAAAGFVRKVTDTINGKTTSKYQRSYSIDVSGPGPWDIRVTKVTTDSTSQLLENQLYFDDFTGVISTQLTYPNSAVIAASIDSQQFQAIPTRGYDIKGLLVKIPSNYNPVTRAYSGTWDGTFVVAWTDNPAWCYYDMLTNSRYGLGDFIDPTQVDKWALYTIAQYCDVLVPSGVGTATEPRFTCNLYLQSPAEAYKVIQNMASIFRAITFWSTGSITVVQDSPQNPIALFSNANVIDGAFTYAGSSIKARHTVAQISWNDPADFYRQKIEYVQDDDGVKTYGVMRADIVAFGCTSRGQANRLGKWLLYSEKAETETVTFRAGLDGFQLYPGAIIKTSDANRAGQRMGGRIVSATTTSATLDAPVTIVAGKTYTLSIIQPDGSVVKTAASAATGQRTVLSLATLPQAPQVNSMFVFEANDLVAETWRIIGVSQPEHHLVEVSAVKHDPTKFAQIELGQKFDPPIITSILVRPDAPTNLSVRTSPYTVNGAVVGLRATFSWSSREGIFKVRWRQAGGIWQERRVTESTIDIDNIDYTAYEFQVYAINQIGRESDVATLNQSITIPPVVLPALTGLALDGAFTSKLARIKWAACAGATSYRVEVLDTASGTTRRIVNVGNALRFDYSSSDMRSDGGPWRALTFKVTPLGQFGSASALPGILNVSNPQVGAIDGVTITGGMQTIFLSYAIPLDPDYVGILVWISTDSTCPAIAGNLLYDGTDSLLVFRTMADKVTPITGNTQYYIRIAGYDDFGKDSLTISGSLSVTPVSAALDANSITAEMIKNGVLDATKFASSIAPIGLAASLPAVSGYAGPLVIYNTTDGKLYRLTGGAWTSSSAAADITGSFADAQIASISAAKVTGVLTDTQIASISTAKLTGQVTSPQLNIAIGGGNLVGNSSFEAVDGSGVPYGYGQYNNGGVPTTVLRITGRQRGYAYGLRALASISNTFGVYGNNAPTVSGLSGGVTGGWLPNTKYVVSWYAKKIGGANWYGMFLAWNTQPVSVLSTSNPNLSTSWQRFSVTVTTGATVEGIGSIYISINGNTATNDEIHIDDVQVEQGDTLTAYAPMPGEIQPGSISATQIAASTITAGQIAANTITAGQILAGTITGNEIAATTITGAKIVGGTITGNEIAAKTITGSKIVGGTITATEIATRTITAGNLVAGSITAAEIAVNTITSGQIAAGAISTAQLAAGAITASKIAITPSGSNIGSDPYFNDFAGSWSPGLMTAATGFGGSAPAITGVVSSAQTTIISNASFAIDSNKTYRLSAHVYSSSTSSNDRVMYLLMNFYDGNGAQMTTGWGGSYSAYPVSGFRPTSGDFVLVQGIFGSGQPNAIPYGVKSCKIGAILQYGGTTGTSMSLTGLRFEEVLPSTLIADGAITTAKMIAGSITGDRITANTLNADRIVANSITADKILANTITGNQIAAGTIQADKLLIGGRNLLANAGPSPGTTAGFTAGAGNMSNVGNIAASFDPWQPQGGGGVYVNAGGAQSSGTYMEILSSYDTLFPCQAGKLYEASAYLSMHRADGWVDIIWWNSSRGYNGETSGSAVGPTSANGAFSNWAGARSVALVTAPAGSAFMSLRARALAYSGTSDPYLFASNWYLSEAMPGQTVASPWSASASTIIDGAGIRTGSITADRIAVGQLSAITATIGTLRTTSSGARTEISDNQIRVYDAANTLRVVLGSY